MLKNECPMCGADELKTKELLEALKPFADIARGAERLLLPVTDAYRHAEEIYRKYEVK